jgi:hypothetical protein
MLSTTQSIVGNLRLFIVAAISFGLVSTVAHAAKPAALALDVSGPTTPQIEPFTELDPKSPIELGPESTIEFLHYQRCETITVQGGRLNFTSQRYLHKGGKVVSVKRAECAKEVALTGASAIGGIVLRSAGKKGVRGTTRPSFVLVGKNADGYVSIRISENGKPILESKLHGRTFFYPDSAPILEKGKFYTVTVTPAGSGKPKTFKLQASRAPAKDTLTLIRVD